MSEINYVIRKNGVSELISAENEFDFLDIYDLLDSYPYIRDAMENEGYDMEYDICDFFDELIFEDKVVGFAAFQSRNSNALLLCECFILPEFRGKRLFFDELCKMFFVSHNFGILQPTRNIVELLIQYSFAKNFNDDIVVSGVDFYFDDFDANSSLNKNLDDDLMDESNFYDLSINSTILADGDEVIYHNLLDNDLKRCGPRKELDEEYFINLKKLFTEHEEELYTIVGELKNELPQFKMDFDMVVGRGNGLSEFMQGMVEENLISYDDAVDLKKQLTKEYDSGEISDDNVDERLTELAMQKAIIFNDFDDFKEFLNSQEDDDEEIPIIKDLIDAIGDNEQLGNEIVNAIIHDDEESFQSLILNQMANDETFMDNFLEIAGELSDEEFFPEDIFIRKPVKFQLDDTVYGKDAPISYDRDIYKMLKNLTKYDELIPAFVFSEPDYLDDLEMMGDFLLGNEFIDNSVNYENWDEFANDELTVPDLKKLLKKNNLKVSGRKQELIDRVSENNLSLDEYSSKHVRITEKGYEYLDRFKWIDLYEIFLQPFDFDDFYNFYETREGDFFEIAGNYLDEHIRIANETSDFPRLSISESVKETLSNFPDKTV